MLNIGGGKKLRNILKTELITHVATYTQNGEIAGYVFLIQDAVMSHYWFSFYAPSQAKQPFGIYMILQEIQAAQTLQKQYFYLGTCYGMGGEYKTNFKPFEHHNGTE